VAGDSGNANDPHMNSAKISGGCEEVWFVDNSAHLFTNAKNFGRDNKYTKIYDNRGSNGAKCVGTNGNIYALVALPKNKWIRPRYADQLECTRKGRFCLDGRNVYNCDRAGADPKLVESCDDVCVVSPFHDDQKGGLAVDYCAPKKKCADGPSSGWCLGSKEKADKKGFEDGHIYGCPGKNLDPVYVQTVCSKGCKFSPPGHDDVCI